MKVTRWRKDPNGVLTSRDLLEARRDPLGALNSQGSLVRYGERPGEDWVEAGYVEGGDVYLPPEEEKQARESLVNVTSGFMKRN
jgi:hypothetical protein